VLVFAWEVVASSLVFPGVVACVLDSMLAEDVLDSVVVADVLGVVGDSAVGLAAAAEVTGDVEVVGAAAEVPLVEPLQAGSSARATPRTANFRPPTCL
jgi:hypothetical protein